MKKLFDKIFLLNDKTRISAFDGVRGLSIIFVLFFHYNPNSLYFLYGGHMGVDIFFVLSGYFIASILFKKNSVNSNYLLNRFLRLMPAYIISLLIIWLLHYDIIKSYKGFIANIFFIPFFDNKIDYMNFVSWTLAWEWLFYFIAFFIYKIDKFFRSNIFLIIIFFLLIFSTILCSFFYKNYQIIRFAGFYLGCLIYLLNLNYRSKMQLYISFTFIFLQILLFGYISEKYLNTTIKIFYYLIFDIFVCILLIGLLKLESFIKNIFKSTPFLFLGKISYSFYLTHAMIGIYISTFLTNYFHLNSFISCINAFLFSILIASIFFIITERPYFIYKSSKKNGA